MVIKRDSITERLKELDTILNELKQYQDTTAAKISSDLSHRWIIERGIIAAASLILDISDHILAGHFGLHPSSYEESLSLLHEKQVISDNLYQDIRGLGGFRNVLVHLYQDIDPQQVLNYFQKGLTVFPQFVQEIFTWLDAQT